MTTAFAQYTKALRNQDGNRQVAQMTQDRRELRANVDQGNGQSGHRAVTQPSGYKEFMNANHSATANQAYLTQWQENTGANLPQVGRSNLISSVHSGKTGAFANADFYWVLTRLLTTHYITRNTHFWHGHSTTGRQYKSECCGFRPLTMDCF